ncbi:arsenic efflux protein [Candidatus Aminicenantes bacterium AC-335-O07]|nr:arsenic efflux protein [Candidatus Aminicenantes bacterium AC-335-O07]
MILFVDLIEFVTKGKLEAWIKKGLGAQYILTSFFGIIPGCFGSFINVSLYIHGLVSFGAIVGGMIATSGDEAFIMLSLFPRKAIFLFAILFILGILFGWITDRIVNLSKIKVCEGCNLQEHHSDKLTFNHYMREHIWNHILRKHIWKVFLWTFFTLLIIETGLKFFNLENIIRGKHLLILLFAVLIGILPQSGPHLIFVFLYSKGLIPFSILLASSMVQDGHGMLPLLSFNVKDSIKVKSFNFLFGILIGIFLLSIGL